MLIVACPMTASAGFPLCSLHVVLFQYISYTLPDAIVQVFLATISFAVGSSAYQSPEACISKLVPRDFLSSSDCRPQLPRSAVSVMHDSWG